MLKIDAYIEDLVSAFRKSGLTRGELARQATLHMNTLRNFGKPAWNPSLITLQRLDRVLLMGTPSPAEAAGAPPH